MFTIQFDLYHIYMYMYMYMYMYNYTCICKYIINRYIAVVGPKTYIQFQWCVSRY